MLIVKRLSRPAPKANTSVTTPEEHARADERTQRLVDDADVAARTIASYRRMGQSLRRP